AGEYARARSALAAALRQDPKVRHAHYYLGMVAVLDQGVAGLPEAIREFRQELILVPADAVTRVRLGMALVEAQQPGEAVPLLSAETSSPLAQLYLGRALLALERPAEAADALKRAAQQTAPGDTKLGNIEYQLGLALRALGDTAAAAEHFAAAER